MFTLIIVPCGLSPHVAYNTEKPISLSRSLEIGRNHMDHDHDGSNQNKFDRSTSHGSFNEFEINFSIFIESRGESSCK